MNCNCKCTNEKNKVPFVIADFEEYIFWKSLDNREIIFNNVVDEFLVERVMMQIIKWNQEDESKPIEERKPIKFYINSGGGDVIMGLGLLDVMQASKTPIHTICPALAASMAALLLIGGHKRYINKNATVLLHDGNLQLSNSAKKAKQTMNYYDSLEERIKNFVIANTKISEELYDEKNDEEWYLFGDQCLELGIVDEVIGS